VASSGDLAKAVTRRSAFDGSRRTKNSATWIRIGLTLADQGRRRQAGHRQHQRRDTPLRTGQTAL
jgi:hypothetical protein